MDDPSIPVPVNLAPVWVVIPAAGRGARMRVDRPKQYLPLAGKTLLQVTLDKILRLPQLAGVVLALSPDADQWLEGALPSEVHRVEGGRERAHSVLRGLDYLVQQQVPPHHWVLVHDAARPCVRLASIEKLRIQVEEHSSEPWPGGILAKPVADTLKRSGSQRIDATVDRSELWQAHTPQMFRLGDLQRALATALAEGCTITDEASAIEQQGGQPLLVEDTRDNIKVTHPEDLRLAELILQQQLSS